MWEPMGGRQVGWWCAWERGCAHLNVELCVSVIDKLVNKVVTPKTTTLTAVPTCYCWRLQISDFFYEQVQEDYNAHS